MARITKPLSELEVKNAKPREKDYNLYDGDGLFIIIAAKGGKRWRYRYTDEQGKRKTVSFGLYPGVSLKQARQKKIDFSPAALTNQEPKKNTPTFRQVVEERFAKLLAEDKVTETHVVRTEKSLRKDVYPSIGSRPIDGIAPPDIRTIMLEMEARGVIESARKVFYSISKTFKYAVARGLCDRNPCADIDLSELLGPKSTNHYPILTEKSELRSLRDNIRTYKGHYSTRKALEMLFHVFTRPANVRLAEWSEFDLDGALWTIPGHKMKIKTHDHLVPLSAEVVSLLKEVREFSGDHRYVFPSARSMNAPMSDVAMVNALRIMGYTKDQLVAHSFRAIFSTIAHEQSRFSSDVIEAALAHQVGSTVKAAYNRAKYLDERRKLHDWWSGFIQAL